MSSIKSIIIRPERKTSPHHVNEIKITTTGIEGDHYDKPDSARQVTLVAFDDLAAVAAAVGFQGDVHAACRRNIMVDSFPFDDMTGKVVSLGDEVILEITGYCKPCTRMEENFGEGAVIAFLNKAGWTARVIREGSISVGDKFSLK